MKINRQKLLNDLEVTLLREETESLSAVPGLGKHTCLKELLQRLKSVGTPHLLTTH